MLDNPIITKMERFGEPYRHAHHESYCDCGERATIRHKFGRMLCATCAREEME